MNNKSLDIFKSLISTLIFILFYKYFPFRVAAILGILYGGIFFIYKYKKYKKLGSFDIVAITGLLIQFILVVISKNKVIYFVYPIISNLIYAIIFGVSLVRKKDVASFLAKDMCTNKKTYIILLPAFRKITFLWLIFFLFKAIIGVSGIIFFPFESLYWIQWIIGTPGYFLLSWFGFYYCKRYYIKNHEIFSENFINNNL